MFEGHQIGDVAVETHRLGVDQGTIGAFNPAQLAGHQRTADAFQQNAVNCGVVINSGLSPSSLDEPASLEWCGM
ncbi:TPA: hypothetical protein GF715_15405 [Citrobacter rodentium NBRC 105723 = DSM 16636]|nr:hypothetical protein [Citrobacter rodentium NBRC 105723 = DSM 16636]HAT8019050.1 hypothetical protein [Citrobacter rodentium]HAT8028707.1 hypothetical protein [Citrobacter rodentium]HAT8033931.1 hypothetical protein [Citrobacter rodentium]HAT8038659.1 hypothetical protein [Citrobacter rodentium]